MNSVPKYSSHYFLPFITSRRKIFSKKKTHSCPGRPRGQAPRWYDPRIASFANKKVYPEAWGGPGTKTRTSFLDYDLVATSKADLTDRNIKHFRVIFFFGRASRFLCSWGLYEHTSITPFGRVSRKSFEKRAFALRLLWACFIWDFSPEGRQKVECRGIFFTLERSRKITRGYKRNWNVLILFGDVWILTFCKRSLNVQGTFGHYKIKNRDEGKNCFTMHMVLLFLDGKDCPKIAQKYFEKWGRNCK